MRSILVIAAALCLGLGGAMPGYAPAPQSGTLACSGGDTMQSLMQSWGRAFVRYNPRAQVTVAKDVRLSADGFAALLEGRVNCVTYVREPFPAEREAFLRTFGHEPLLVHVANGSYATKSATHAIAIFVNAANPIERLDLTQLDAVFSKTLRRGAPREITRWGQLGLGGVWAGRPIHVYSMLRGRESGNPPGIVNYLQQRVFLGGQFRDDVVELRDTPEGSALQSIVRRVAGDPAGIGYSGFGFAEPGAKSVMLGETAEGPFLAGTPDEVATGAYPLSRKIYLLFGSSPRETPAPLVAEFLRFVLSAEGQQIVAEDGSGFIPLTPAQVNASRAAIAFTQRY